MCGYPLARDRRVREFVTRLLLSHCTQQSMYLLAIVFRRIRNACVMSLMKVLVCLKQRCQMPLRSNI